MALYTILAACDLTTSDGKIPAGSQIATIESDLQPADLGSWLLYGHARAELQNGDAELLTMDTIRESRAAPPKPVDAPPVDEEQTPDAGTEGDETGETTDDAPPADADAWATELKLDSRTVDALNEAGVESVDALRKLMNADKKIKGIGELREQEIMEAFERMDASA